MPYTDLKTALESTDQGRLAPDPDFEGVRETAWFQDLLAKQTPSGDTTQRLPKVRTVRISLSPSAKVTQVTQDGKRFKATIDVSGSQFTIREDEPEGGPDESEATTASISNST